MGSYADELREALRGTLLQPPTSNPDMHGGLWGIEAGDMKGRQEMEAVNDAMLRVLPKLAGILSDATGAKWKMRSRAQDWIAAFHSPGYDSIMVTWRPSVSGFMSISFMGKGLSRQWTSQFKMSKLNAAYLGKLVGDFVSNNPISSR